MSVSERILSEAMAAFDFGAPVVGAVRYGTGHVNDTYCVHTQPADLPCRRFILQRISAMAFKRPDELMSNITGVTDYLRKAVEKAGGDASRETMTVCPTRDGKSYYTDSEGGAWRVYTFVEHTRCLQSAATPELFAASGRAFGRFQRLLGGYPADTLYETIPHFHDTEQRLLNFKAALAADALGRAGQCVPETQFILARESDCSVALGALREGKLPLRVTHNDTKLNNVLMDEKEDVGVCIIDLDTVMPGLAINDFGDSIRFGANHCAEDERDLTKVWLDVGLYRAYAKAFLEGCGGVLTKEEIEYLPWGAKLMTLECGMRFLTDFLEGDRYFHTTREGQNLDRCRTQLKLVADMEAHWDELQGAI